MIKENYFTNIVVLSDWIKTLVNDLEMNFMIAVKMSEDILKGQDFIVQVLQFRRKTELAQINIILTTAFFLEAYINAFGYEFYEKNQGANAARSFIQKNQSTIDKWRSIFPNEVAFHAELQEIFRFRNFVAHARPIVKENGGWKTFSKSSSSWVEPSSLCKYLSKATNGLLLEGLNMNYLDSVAKVKDDSVDLIFKTDEEFNSHYNLKTNWEIHRKSIEELSIVLSANEKKYGEMNGF